MSHSITLRLDAKTIQRIRHLAAHQKTTPSNWVRNLVLAKIQELDDFQPARQPALCAMAQPIEVAEASLLNRAHVHER